MAMTRQDLVRKLNKIGLTKNQANAAVDTFFNRIVVGLKEQKTVSIVGFGTWEWRDRKSRMARNPKTGKAVALGARKSLVFKPSQMLKNKLKG
jgi:integration host factor subunit alpha